MFAQSNIGPFLFENWMVVLCKGGGVCRRLRHALAIIPPGNKLESMAENDETATVRVEVEMADSSEEPEGSFESVIKVRITASEQHACELIREAVLLAIQTALGDDKSEDPPTEPVH
jgi:hypothetical protein